MTQQGTWQQGEGGAAPGGDGRAAGDPRVAPDAPAAPYSSVSTGFAGQGGAAGSFACPPSAGQVYAASQNPGPFVGSPYPSQPPAKRRGWIVALVAVVLFFVTIMLGMASCASFFAAVGPSPASDALDASLVTSDSVGVIDISGTIQYDGTTASPEGLKEQLDIAEGNPYIKAVVLRVDSGGGTATAGEEMATYLGEFSKPVVVSSASMNASAAYEVSSQADYIFTAKTTAIGAIGTAMQVTDLSGLYEKLGIGFDNIVSSDSKDSTYGTRPLSEEERAYYQAQVDQINESFVQTVAEGRGMPVEEVRLLATGLTFTGVDAVGNGLADEVGTLEDAVAKAAELAGLAHYDAISLQQDAGDLSCLLDLMGSQETGSDEASVLREWENHVRFEG